MTSNPAGARHPAEISAPEGRRRRTIDAWAGPSALALAIVGALWLLMGLLIYPSGEGWGYDTRAYLDAARRLAETGSLYQAETLSGAYRPGPYGLYMYAPPLGVAFGPALGLNTETSIVAWYALHVLALTAACALLPVRGVIRLAALGVAALSYAASRDLVLGNVSTLLLLPLAVAWRWLDRPTGAVATAIAISVRPTLGMVVVWQAMRRQWRAVAWTALAGLALVLVTLPFVGIDGYRDYLTVLRNLSDVTGVPRNLDVGSTARSLGLDEPWPSLALLAGYVLAAVAVLLSLRRDREVGFVVAASASLLLSPLLWDHYLVILVLPAALLAARGHPVGLLLPLLTWLPPEFQPVAAVVGVLAPFWARDRASAEPRHLSGAPLDGRLDPRLTDGAVP